MGDTTKKVSYEISAEASGFTKTVEEVAGKLTGMTDQVNSQFGKIGEVFEEVQSKLLLITGIIAGGKVFKEAIDEANKLTDETLELSRRLGITAEDASALNTALDDLNAEFGNVNADTYIQAFDKFAMQLRSNEQGLKEMGLQTRDNNGHLRDSTQLFRDALGVVSEYKPGIDQATAAQKFFGRSVDDVIKLQKLNNEMLEEARKKNEELGLTVTKEGIATSLQYKAAMNDVGDVLLAVKNAIGQAIMPAFTEMGRYFAQSGPYVVDIFKGALTGLMLVFRSLKMVVQNVMAVIFETINMSIDQFSNLGELISAVLHGDFDAAAAAGKRMSERWGQGFSNVKNEMADNLKEAQASFGDDTQRIWGKGTAADAPEGGSKRMGDLNKSSGGAMSKWEAELTEAKQAFQEQQNLAGSFRQYDKQAELQFWRDKLAITLAGSNDNLAVRKRIADLQLQINKDAFDTELGKLKAQESAYKNNTQAKLAILDKEAELVKQRYGQDSKEYQDIQKSIVDTRRQAAEQIRQVAELQAQAERQARLSQIALEEQAAQIEVELGLRSSAQLLEQQRQFEDQRYQIALQALQRKAELWRADPDRSPAVKAQLDAQIEALEQQHQLRILQIQGQMAKESPLITTWKATQTTIGNAVGDILTKQKTLQQGMTAVWNTIRQNVSAAISKMLQDMLMGFVRQRLMTMAGIGMDAAKAGTGAAASQASIPFVGPTLAMAAMAAIFGSVSAMSSKVPSASAAGGYDIPGSINPVVQAHAREMILPAKHADVIRQMADNGGVGGGDVHHWQINAVDARGFEDMLMKRGGADVLIRALTERRRNGGLGGRLA